MYKNNKSEVDSGVKTMCNLVRKEDVFDLINNRIKSRKQSEKASIWPRNCEALEIQCEIDNMSLSCSLNGIMEQLLNQYNYCMSMYTQNEKEGFYGMMINWALRAEGVRDAIEILKGCGLENG